MNPSVWLTAWLLDSKRLHKRRGCFLLEQQLIKKPAIENMFHEHSCFPPAPSAMSQPSSAPALLSGGFSQR